MDEHEHRLKELEKRFTEMIDEIDRSHLRKMQGDMHRCAANCCDNKSYSMERNQNCIENCSVPVQNAQQFVQTEVNRLQNRWSRCLMECNDKMQDAAIASKKDTSNFGTCVTDCINIQSNLMQIAKTNIDRVLASGKYSNV